MSRAAPDAAPVAVVGAGAWGTALAVILGTHYPDVLLWVLEEHLASSRSVAEGVNACRSTLLRARMHGIEMPICQAVHRVLLGGQDPQQVVPELMARDLKVEDACAHTMVGPRPGGMVRARGQPGQGLLA